jgi:AAA domain
MLQRRLFPRFVRPSARITRHSHLTHTKTGNEDEVIIISVVRTKALGFLTSLRRTNVMLTRCKRRMYIVSNRAFLEGKGADSLVGKMATELGKRPGAWLTQQDLENGKFD